MSNFAVERGEVLFTGDEPETEEEALALSIEKWEFICEQGDDVNEGGYNTCGLCMRHEYCSGCPIATFTGEHSCLETPYDDYGYATGTGRAGHAGRVAAAKREVEFLKQVQAWWLKRQQEAVDETEETG